MGVAVYRGAVALKEWGERGKLGPVVSLGKFAVSVVSRVVCVGGKRERP
jgi:hypothetical protein